MATHYRQSSATAPREGTGTCGKNDDVSQTTSQTPVPDDAFDEVVTLCSELIAIDSTNTGDPATLVGEREAAEYVAAARTKNAPT